MSQPDVDYLVTELVATKAILGRLTVAAKDFLAAPGSDSLADALQDLVNEALENIKPKETE